MPERRMTFLGALLDTRFENYATAHLVRAAYGATLVLASMQCCFWFLTGHWMAGGHLWPFAGWVMMLSTPAVWVGEITAVRVALEYVVVMFRMSEDLRALRDQAEWREK
ncbi:hypothetical protein GCM10023196_060370 [Actinoallomurus vinaceus]|uniref:DUF4282 domain-containing protein n=1 Tax=Actinoallomurus vinaceus TaxID=1080074 RepID=A0ABP8UIN9_9ACTN